MSNMKLLTFLNGGICESQRNMRNGFLKVLFLINKHIFPNHISRHHVPKANSALSKIQEKSAKLKATQESTNLNATSTSR